MSYQKPTIEEMENCSLLDLPKLLRVLNRNIGQTQENVLMDIIAEAKDTEIGKKYHFDQITSIKKFQKKVPITEFSDYHDAIEKMKLGEEDILFQGKADSFVITTGTTGIPKYIPESKKGAAIKKIVGNMRTVEMIGMMPMIMQPQNKILALTNVASYGKTEGGIPTGSASGQAAGATTMQNKLVLPAKLLILNEISSQTRNYLILLFSMAEQNIAALICNNVAYFNIILNEMESNMERLLDDIKYGTISIDIKEEERQLLLKKWTKNPERAKQLRKIFEEEGKITIEKMWPSFQAVSCWLSGSVGRSAKEFAHLFPKKTDYLEWGYGASEGKFNIPIKKNAPEGIMAVFGYFFEFIPIGGGEPLLLEETEAGNNYELILTSYSGFYRYNIHDIVHIDKDENGFKTMEFLCKMTDKLTLNGKDLYAGELTKFVEEYEQKNDILFRLFQGEDIDGKLQLYVESVADTLDVNDFTAYMTEKLYTMGIVLNGVEKKKNGYRDSLFAKVTTSRKSVSATKLLVFIKK